jgi:alcohol dehydrogenase (cytochrome c)
MLGIKQQRLILLVAALLFVLGSAWISRRGMGGAGGRTEIIQFKLKGVLPDETWTSVIGRAIRQPDIDGLHLNIAATSSAVKDGGLLYERYCSYCHGVGGKGGAVGVDLAGNAAQSGLSNLDIYTAITRGRSGNMPVISRNVNEALNITTYVRSLGSLAMGTESVKCTSCSRINVSSEDIAANFKGSGNWLSYSGDYTGQRFSPYTQINKGNISKLRPRFVHQTRSAVGLETVPIVLEGLMILTGGDNQVIALDLETGDPFWEYRRVVLENVPPCCGRRSRGVALLGNRIFHGTLDGRLVALDVRTGRELWNVEVVDYRQRYAITGAPLAIKDKIIVGVSGGDYGSRGVIDAYEPATGRRLWRFDTVPAPGQPGHETWPAGDGWKRGGGATWLTGTYDPDLQLVYWGVGNPAKIFNPGSRPGDNLYTESVVALDAATGALRWHYQFTPNDGNDWDANSIPVLVDRNYGGVRRKLMLFANRNCFFYALDRETGKFLNASPFCDQNWNDGFTAEGRPIRRPGSVASADGPLIKPGITGGANWMSPAYDPTADLFAVKFYQGGTRVYSQNSVDVMDAMGGRDEQPPDIRKVAHVAAIQGASGKVIWDVDQGSENNSGVLATAAGIVFTGDSKGRLVALDIATGKELWNFNLGAQISMAPITYLHQGAQEILVVSGGAVFVFGLS